MAQEGGGKMGKKRKKGKRQRREKRRRPFLLITNGEGDEVERRPVSGFLEFVRVVERKRRRSSRFFFSYVVLCES